jgi:hypothetical protein
VAQRQADEIPTVATRDDVVGVFGEIETQCHGSPVAEATGSGTFSIWPVNVNGTS